MLYKDLSWAFHCIIRGFAAKGCCCNVSGGGAESPNPIDPKLLQRRVKRILKEDVIINPSSPLYIKPVLIPLRAPLKVP